ncbi:peptide-methionine (R)-S-oxide reductase MsrB [Candidatus Venteria ishoeyi]|uniref:Peptide methionine sulfoxide reductase MsrB n=1 Tax=Candidatus Venteria ishoeyi TaxID=1899563 RepID=A0A1H6FHA5_9GAMM|nr:peptide-methionine (R)-S-oxide reductase MsrB [Candidatus Venteria ishoeyi]SEH08415.1 Peptide methionine sulfoxide reductase MsrB [Candidatus Venteria ishoeyi]
MFKKIQKTDAQWREQLGADTYRICREKSTEPAFSGRYYQEKASGTYHCACCGAPLFSSTDKYDSGSGWPSFMRPLTPENITQHSDNSHNMQRTEVTCQHCDAHLGHVFPDGPEPTGLRYCINSASLNLKKPSSTPD